MQFSHFSASFSIEKQIGVMNMTLIEEEIPFKVSMYVFKVISSKFKIFQWYITFYSHVRFNTCLSAILELCSLVSCEYVRAY